MQLLFTRQVGLSTLPLLVHWQLLHDARPTSLYVTDAMFASPVVVITIMYDIVMFCWNELLIDCRWAMIDQLRKPKPGFEEVTKAHFRRIRCSLLNQCKTWFSESAEVDVLYRRRLADAIVELHGLLAAL